MGDSLNLCIRSQEQNAKPSSFVAGPFLVLNWSFTCQFAHSLVGQLHRELNLALTAHEPDSQALDSSWRQTEAHMESNSFDLI